MTVKGITRSNTRLVEIVELGVGLAGLIALFLLIGSEASSDLRLVLYFVAGALTMTLLSLLNAAAKAPSPQSQRLRLTFNVVSVTQRIDEAWRKADAHPSLPPSPSSAELSPRSMLGQDNELALAYLRMEIERALRLILDARGLNWAGASMASVTKILDGLVRQSIVESVWESPIDEVLSACNRAVHGAVVPDETALAIISSGEQILQYLRSLVQPASPTTV